MRDEISQLILYLIRDEMSISQIASILNLSYKQIYHYVSRLRMEGYEISGKYYANGNMRYYLKKQLCDESNPRLITEKQNDTVEFLVYSDLHFGSIYETPGLLKKLFEYGDQNNIHLHLNLGDLIDGSVRASNMRLPWDRHIDYALDVYPHRDDVLIFLILGNHDQSVLVDYGFNITKKIERRRGDIIPLGFGSSILEIKNDYIVLQHNLMKPTNVMIEEFFNSLILRGHHHQTKFYIKSSNIIVYLASLSDMNFHKSHFPGALHLRIKFRNGLIEFIDYDELTYINDKFEITHTSNIYIGNERQYRENVDIKNEEDNPKMLRRTL